MAPHQTISLEGIRMSESSQEDKSPYIMSWRELVSKDPAKSQDFYVKLFGWTAEKMDMGPAGTYTFFKAGDRPVAGMIQAPEGFGGGGSMWMDYVTVPNVDQAVEKATELGAKVCKEKTTIPMGSFAIINDPQGGVIGLWEFAEESPCND